jgi:hypothetical protein
LLSNFLKKKLSIFQILLDENKKKIKEDRTSIIKKKVKILLIKNKKKEKNNKKTKLNKNSIFNKNINLKKDFKITKNKIKYNKNPKDTLNRNSLKKKCAKKKLHVKFK